MKGHIVNIFGFQDIQPLPHLLGSAIGAQKQPRATRKQMGMAVSP